MTTARQLVESFIACQRGLARVLRSVYRLHDWQRAITNPGTINRVMHWFWATKRDVNQLSTNRAHRGWYCRLREGYWKTGLQIEEEAVDSHSTDHPVQSSARTRNLPIRYGLAYTHALVTGIKEPRGYSEAVSGPIKEQWLASMAFEVQCLEAIGTWTLVDRPRTRKLFLDDGFFAAKRDVMGQEERFKSWYVVKTFMQVKGFVFTETFSPTCTPKTKRILFALGALDDLKLHQMDAKTALLNSLLTETMYMEQPEAFRSGDSQVYSLKRSLHGLQQAGTDWY